MKQKIIIPNGWPCMLSECPPGPFVTTENPNLLCFKSEYFHDDSTMVLALNSSGEFFHGLGNKHIVQPVEMIEAIE